MLLLRLEPTLLATFLSLFSTAQASAQCTTLYPGEILRPPGGPTRIASGDLDGDLRPDLVVGEDNGVAVYMNQGSECLQLSSQTPIPSPLRSIALGDLNNDGFLDFASSHAASVYWALGDGQGGFGPLTSFATGNLPSGARLGDVTGDGNIDLCFVQKTPDSVVVLAGDGLGNLTPSAQLPIPSIPMDVELADVDNDGDLDLITDSYTSTSPQAGVLTVFLALGGGSYSSGIVENFSFTCGRLHAGHFDQNNRIDVLVGRSADGPSTLFTGNGDGTFALSVSLGGVARVAVSVDVDLDGDLDVLMPEFNLSIADSPRIKKHTNDGQGNFTASGGSAGGGSLVLDAVSADWNGDGFPDIALFDGYWRGVQICWGNGAGGFRRDVPLIMGPRELGVLALSDLNHDGFEDLIGSVGVLETAPFEGFFISLSTGDGQFAAPTWYAVGAVPVRALTTGDFNHDGNVDVAAIRGVQVNMFFGDGTGALPLPAVHSMSSGDYRTLVATDINGDGFLDLISCSRVSTPSFVSLLNDGAGGFTVLQPGGPGSAQGLYAGDFNADGHVDMLCTKFGAATNDMTLALGDGTGGFWNHYTLGLGRTCIDAAVGDFDQDGNLDAAVVALGGANDSALLFLRGDGAGAFTASVFSRPLGTGQCRAADIDLDGDLDVVTAYLNSHCVGISMNDGTGNFAELRLLASARGPKSIAVGDINGDGRPDLVAGGAAIDGTSIHVHESTTSLIYCTAKVNSQGCTPSIASTGMASASAASGFVVRSTQVLNNKPGLLLYGVSGRAATPFQNGFLCIHPAVRRTPGSSSGGNPGAPDCSGAYAIDMNSFAAGALGGNPQPALTMAGTVVDAQCWARDNGFSPPNNTSLSDALEYVVQP